MIVVKTKLVKDNDKNKNCYKINMKHSVCIYLTPTENCCSLDECNLI